MIAHNALDRIIEATQAKRSGDGWKARCPAPAHEDRKASLSITEGDDGRTLVHCHAGCKTEAVMHALGLTMRDLMPDTPSPSGTLRKSTKAEPCRQSPTYIYRDRDGNALFGVLRRRKPDGGKEFPQVRPDGKGGWLYGLGDVQRVLYRLPEVAQAVERGDTVYIPEGEKDADRLCSLGLTATTSPMGAGSWRDAYSEDLKGADVVILPDNDDPGHKHAEQVARSLHDAGAKVSILELEGLPDKGDVSDWLDAGRTVDELRELVAAAPEWEPSEADKEEPWEQPVPFFQVEAPVFPTQTLPQWQREFVEAEATATQTPPDLAALQTLSVEAATVQRKVVVLVREGWTEPLNIFTAIVLVSGTRKTQVTKDTTAPLEDWEEREAARVEPEIQEATTKYRIMEQRLQHLQSKAAKEKDSVDRDDAADEAGKLAQEMAGFEIPTRPRIIADDATPEKLQSLMKEQDGRMAVIAAEGDVFDIMKGRYSSSGQANFGVYLKGHAGDTLRVDRVGRPSEYVRNPALTVALAVQPEVLRGLHQESGFRGRGLLGRFLYALPESQVGQRDINAPPVPDWIRKEYTRRVEQLLSLPWNMNEDGKKCAHVLRFSESAKVRFLEFMARIEPELARSGELGPLADWGGKLAGAVARLAGLLHVGDYAGESSPWERPIAEETVERAITIGEYLIPHAKAAYAEMGADSVVEDARYLLDMIDRKTLTSFTKQEIWQITKGRFKKVDGLNDGLELLVEHGYLREHIPETSPGRVGRKPAPTYDVNPHFSNCRHLRDGSLSKPFDLTEKEESIHKTTGRTDSYNSYNSYNTPISGNTHSGDANSRDISNCRNPDGPTKTNPEPEEVEV